MRKKMPYAFYSTTSFLVRKKIVTLGAKHNTPLNPLRRNTKNMIVSKQKTVWIMTSLALTLFAAQFVFAKALPLLTKLFISEFGFVVCLAGLYNSIGALKAKNPHKLLYPTAVICILLAVFFMSAGIESFPTPTQQ